MAIEHLKRAVRGLRVPERPDLSAFDERQRQALRPLAEAAENFGRLLEEIRRLPEEAPDTGTEALAQKVAGLEVRAGQKGPEPGEPSRAHLFAPNAGLFRVTVTKDGGVAGNVDNNCTWTYTVTSLAGEELATTVTPEKPRYPKCAYEEPAAGSPGLAFWHTDDTVKLYEVLEEIPDTTVC